MTEPVDTAADLEATKTTATNTAQSTTTGLLDPQLLTTESQVIVTIEPLAPFSTPQQPTSAETLDSEPQVFFTPGAVASNLAGATTTPTIMTTRVIRRVTTPIQGNDPMTRAMEARRVSTLNRQVHLQ